MEFFSLSNPHFYIAIAISILNGAILCFVAGKPLQMLQLSGYKLSGYNAWLKDTKIKYFGRLIMLSFLSLISILVTNALLDGFGNGYYSYLGLIFYIYFAIVFIINITKMPQKTPLKQTRRMNRLIATTFILVTFLSFNFIAFSTEYLSFLRYGAVVLTPIVLTLIVPLAHLINYPLERYIRNKYIKKANKKLEKMPNLIKIGITGSYGKTTTKHILNVMLSKKYSVCMTPHSFNTPMGLTKVVLKYLKKDNQVLIAEMGARNVGDIKYLCDFIKPKHAIITAVASQHLATFGTLENISKTKNELVEAIGEGGYVIFNAESEGAFHLYEKCQKDKYLSGVENDSAFCNIKNIDVSSSGSKFTLVVEGNEIECESKLVGKQFLEDIALASAMAYKLGVTLTQIKEAISELKPMAHRMEIINNNGLTIIDNSYNSSIESSCASIQTLKLFAGDKIVVTPGIVEMGVKEYEANVNLGKQMASICSKVVIVNKVNLEAIKQGLIDGGFNEENILEAESLKDASKLLQTITKPNDVILFENDLPDNYT